MSYAERMIRKLRLANRLDAEDIEAIENLPIRERKLAPHAAVVRQGERPDHSCLVVEGFAYRARLLPDGRRQILSLHIPGDMPDLQSLHLHVMDYDLRACGTALVGLISHADIRKLCRARPRIAEAMWKETLIDAAKYREWLVNVAQRPAESRLAHLVAELDERLSNLGLMKDGVIKIPLTQADLGDCLGLTSVHLNRVTKSLREQGVVEFRRGAIHMLDREKLRAMCAFDPLYLHQSPEL